ncbi:MAG: hypothetical protein KME64_35735 [Scytonematopsis contorta HA4267-MV1]|nr:hypothetical protein [Scytonematopsis contorta HA4267-MV1]
MTKAEILEALKQMSAEERLEIIETASKLIREEITAKSQVKVDKKLSLADSAKVMYSFYEQGSELAAFTELNTEDFYEYEDYA